MDSPHDSPQRLEALEADLASRDAAMIALQQELEETNRGVVALYAELDAQAAQLREANELKSRFLSYMSHEFRAPIMSIQSLSRLLLDGLDGELNDEQRKQVTFIRSTAVEFHEMVDDLLDLAKVEAGRVEISSEWFEMVDLFAALRGMFRPILTNPDVVLLFEEPVDIPRLFSDNRKLAQILRNFISNALKFTERGEVRITAHRVDGERVRFAVSDTGIGIAKEFHHALFQDFVQVDSPIQKRLRGTGLGLSLSKRLAELLGGTVGVTSEPGKGSVFFVTLPMRGDDVQVAPKIEGGVLTARPQDLP